jgi:hypothetical protein
MRCVGFLKSSVFEALFTNHPVIGTVVLTPIRVWDGFGLKHRELEFKYFMWRLPTLTLVYYYSCNGLILDRIINCVYGRAIAQEVSRWLPTAAARVRAQVWSNGICGGQSGEGAGFLRVLRIPLPIFIPPNSPSS